MRSLILFFSVFFVSLFEVSAHASFETESSATQDPLWSLHTILGYSLGGLTPIPMPAEIREIRKFSPMGGLRIGVDVVRRMDHKWSLSGGLYFFDRGMDTEARVKGYHIAVVQGDQHLEGYFTGYNATRARQQGVAVPVLMHWHPFRGWTVSAGPYVEYYLFKRFSGDTFSGYLRVNDPTGEKVDFGEKGNGSATYDFGDDLRSFGVGVQVGIERRIWREAAAFVRLDYGLSGAFKGDFHTIPMTMYPVFLSLGVSYSFALHR